MALRIIEQASRTDVGRQRNANEDSLVVDPPMFAVALTLLSILPTRLVDSIMRAASGLTRKNLLPA